MITAEEARQIVGSSTNEQITDALDYLSGVIENAAKVGDRSVIIKEEPFATWAWSDDDLCEVGEQVLYTLIDNGYELERLCEPNLRGHSLYISWGGE